MLIHVKNFGPINEATVETKPFTIIIGKNNQGKSYCVELIFTLLQLRRGLSVSGYSYDSIKGGSMRIRPMWGYSGRSPFQMTLAGIRSARTEITLNMSDFTSLTIGELAKKLIDQTISCLIALSENSLSYLLEERFGMKPGALVNANSSHANIDFAFSEYLSFSVTISKEGTIKVEGIPKTNIASDLKDLTIEHLEKIHKQFDKTFNVNVSENRHLMPTQLFEAVADLARALLGTPKRQHIPEPELIYIPAGRAGLLEGYYSVAAAYFSLATVALTRGVSMPAMPPTASVFYNLFMDFLGRSGKMNEIAVEMAKEVLGGEIILELDSKQPGLKKMTYRFSGKNRMQGDIDIIHAGSMVKELAGLYLAIREKTDRETQLIVEEPEAHLHPSAQRRLARILMKLAARGIRITITTHSDIILREVAHLVGRFKEEAKEDILPSDSVSVVLLKEGNAGSISEELKIPLTGILKGLPTFDEVIMQLYEEEVDLESQGPRE